MLYDFFSYLRKKIDACGFDPNPLPPPKKSIFLDAAYKWKLCTIVDYIKYIMNIRVFWYPHSTLYKYGVEGVGWGDTGITWSVCPSVVLSVSPILSAQHLLNYPAIVLPNLVWWCIFMRQCVRQKNWFTISSVKVTVRAFIIKICLFLLYLLNCWLVRSQTWFDNTAS